MLNINTGETHEIEFPYSSNVWAFGGSIDIRDNYVSFSPDLEKVIYASTMSHLVLRNNSVYGDGKWRTITWVGFSFTYSNPSWSPDSSTFIFVMDTNENIQGMPINNLFQVSADFGVGEKQLTDLGSMFNNPYQIRISQFDWSPDGEKIALIARVTPNEGDESLSRLLVLDVETGEIEDYCNPDPENPYSTNSFSFTWSPDSKYIATDTVIVDLASRIAYKIPDVYIVDWVGEGKSR
jgi:Tol biopolymer transport system component